ncbi:hypothetical protein CYY_009956 [Polysphondylium violaceum]|uniref:Transmembrane protein n=1 Tax=Polysphondylium violaceum TaxID=133409 RepID=A0A8J4V044_9MYCE|nr:hypothetical protein CYY_009956 [Polysphondylium violaceum]
MSEHQPYQDQQYYQQQPPPQLSQEQPQQYYQQQQPPPPPPPQVKVYDEESGHLHHHRDEDDVPTDIGAIIFFVTGFCFPLLWLCGLCYISSRNPTSRIFAIISLVLFALAVICSLAIVVPVVVVRR